MDIWPKIWVITRVVQAGKLGFNTNTTRNGELMILQLEKLELSPYNDKITTDIFSIELRKTVFLSPAMSHHFFSIHTVWIEHLSTSPDPQKTLQKLGPNPTKNLPPVLPGIFQRAFSTTTKRIFYPIIFLHLRKQTYAICTDCKKSSNHQLLVGTKTFTYFTIRELFLIENKTLIRFSLFPSNKSCIGSYTNQMTKNGSKSEMVSSKLNASFTFSRASLTIGIFTTRAWNTLALGCVSCTIQLWFSVFVTLNYIPIVQLAPPYFSLIRLT